MALSQEDQKKLENLKGAHDIYATALQVFTTRVQWYHEEFEGTQLLVSFFRKQKETLLAAIHELEPPAPKEVPAAYAMDLTHIKPDASPIEAVTQ